VSGTSHPALKFCEHEFVGTVDQGEIANSAIPITTVVKSDVISRTTETANFRIAPDDDIKRSSNACNPTTEI
jgi:hypothetical protein